RFMPQHLWYSCNSPSPGPPLRLSAPRDRADEPAEDHAVHGIQTVPVQPAGQTTGCEERSLRQQRAPVIAGRGVELEPRVAGDFHLRAEPHHVIRYHRFDAPEVERIADAYVVRITTSATQADAADQAVRHSADAPQCVHVQPATLAAQARERAIHIGR